MDKRLCRFHDPNAFKVGDIVKITEIAHSNEGGWPLSWNPNMNKHLGKICKITECISHGFRTDVDETYSWIWPSFVLEKTKSE